MWHQELSAHSMFPGEGDHADENCSLRKPGSEGGMQGLMAARLGNSLFLVVCPHKEAGDVGQTVNRPWSGHHVVEGLTSSVSEEERQLRKCHFLFSNQSCKQDRQMQPK